VNSRRTSRLLAIALCALPVLWTQGAQACAACFGGDGKLAEGMAAGILSLLFVVTCVLGGIALFFVHIVRRERQVQCGIRNSEGGMAAAAPDSALRTSHSAFIEHELH